MVYHEAFSRKFVLWSVPMYRGGRIEDEGFQSPETLSSRITKNEDFVIVSILTSFFCIRKTVMASDDLPQNMIPYEIWDWK